MSARVTITFASDHPAALAMSWADALGLPRVMRSYRIRDLEVETVAVDRAVESEGDRSREGLDILLRNRPGAVVTAVEHQGRTGPWVLVDLRRGDRTEEKWAIWCRTGVVFPVGEDGAVADDATFVP